AISPWQGPGAYRVAAVDAEEAEQLCDALAELASKGPSKDPGALVEARAILGKITQSPQATTHVRDLATTVERALSGGLDSDEKFQRVLKSHSRDVFELIER